MDHARFQRLAQHLEHAAVPFGELVQEQHAVMRERNFARARVAAAADQCHCARGVMRRAERTLTPPARNEPAAIDATAATSSASSSASGGSNAGSRWASIDLPVPGGPMNNSECPPAAAISSARFACACPRTSLRSGLRAARAARPRPTAAKGVRAVRCAHTASSVGRADRPCACTQRGFAGRRLRQHERAAVAPRREGHRQRAAHGAQLAGQRELAGELVARKVNGRDLPRWPEDAQRDRQIVAARLLGQIRGARLMVTFGRGFARFCIAGARSRLADLDREDRA